MEDSIVKPNHYAYSFRVDISIADGLTKVMEFMKHYEVKYYIVGAEVSKEGKEHFQCILWFAERINATKLRNWWKGKTSDTKQPVSLTSAKKIKSLGKYTMKEGQFTTNLTPEEVKSIGKWSQKLEKIQWAELLEKHALGYKEGEHGQDVIHHFTNNEMSDYYGAPDHPRMRMYSFISYMLCFYLKHNKRPSRANLQYLAWKHGHMSNVQLIKQWF